MNILITSASRKVGLVRAFQEASTAEGGGQVIAVDTSPLAAALYLADERYLVPPSTSTSFLDALRTICQRHQVQLLVPTRDEELPLFARHQETFAAFGTRVMVPSLAAIETCQNKRAFVQFCMEHGFAVPRTYPDHAAIPRTSFPLFIKPMIGKGGMGTRRIDSPAALDVALAECPDALVQECIQAPEYTIDLFADFDGQVISIVPRERVRIVGGESFISITARRPMLMEPAEKLARALGLTGHNTIQCFLDQDGVKFIEVNPRFGGAAHLSFAAGACTPRYLVQLLKGEVLAPRIGSFQDRYVMLRYTQDIYLDADDLLQAKVP
jgi:carbamoyl-phosphate synthase large subunit